MTKRRALMISAAFLFLIAAVLFAVKGIRVNRVYAEALHPAESGDAVQADTLLTELDGLKEGDTVLFGSCEQDNDMSDGSEPVEWMVLERIEDEILLLSVSCLDCRAYNDVPFEPVTWEECGLRRWLNEEFYGQAFSEEEKQLVMLAENVNPDQSAAGTEGGADTEDYVFLLCEKEAGIYMGDEMNRDYIGRACATEYAISRGAHTDDDGMCEWWLRTPGAYEYAAQFVEADGSLYVAGAYVDIAYAVRPAVWLKTGQEDGR